MRRSNSSSHIPLPKIDARQRSRSGVRTSTKPVFGSTQKARAGSSTGLTPIVGLTGFKRSTSNLTTPKSSRSRSRSPYKIGSERTVNDKKWVSQQFAKVQQYLRGHSSCPEHIPDILKPPTINTFIFVINLLLKEVDPYIEINNANYKEVVLSMLKLLHYPGNVSNSLLKTVNTMHAWPQIISIFSWLVDLITTIKRVEQPVSPQKEQDLKYKKIECVTKYIIERYLRYNNGEGFEDTNRALVEDFAKILNIDEEELKRLKNQVTNLSQLKEKQTKSVAEQKLKNDEIKEEIDRLQNEIDTFYGDLEANRENIDCAITLLKERKLKLVDAVEAKKASIAELTEAIKVQPCTVEEKKKMLNHIEEMKHTIDLQKEKIKVQKSIKDNWELKMTEAKKKVETEVYRLNENLMKLAPLEPNLKILHLKETDFLSAEFKKDVESMGENIKMFENKFNTEIEEMKSLISKINIDNSALEQQIESSQKNIQTLTESERSVCNSIESFNNEMETMSKKREEQKQIFLQKMKELKSAEPDLSQIQERLQQVTELKNKKVAEFETHKEKSLEFFVKVHDSVTRNLVEMNNVRTEIFELFTKCLKQIGENQKDIIEDLGKLEELRE